MTHAELTVHVSRLAGFGGLAALYANGSLPWWAAVIGIPVVGIGAFFVPVGFLVLLSVVTWPFSRTPPEEVPRAVARRREAGDE